MLKQLNFSFKKRKKNSKQTFFIVLCVPISKINVPEVNNQSAEGTAFVWVHKTVQRPGKKTVQFKNTTLQIST